VSEGLAGWTDQLSSVLEICGQQECWFEQLPHLNYQMVQQSNNYTKKDDEQMLLGTAVEVSEFLPEPTILDNRRFR
jgi:hypothetical protein